MPHRGIDEVMLSAMAAAHADAPAFSSTKFRFMDNKELSVDAHMHELARNVRDEQNRQINTNNGIRRSKMMENKYFSFQRKRVKCGGPCMFECDPFENLNNNIIQITDDRLFFACIQINDEIQRKKKTEIRKQTDSDRRTGISSSQVRLEPANNYETR